MSKTFARQAATDQRLLKRSCESLLGIAAGVLADQELNDTEIGFLDLWLRDHADIATTWPGEVIHRRVSAALQDGVITEDEREHLKDTLSALIGGTLEETGAAGGLSTTLPLDEVDAVAIDGSSFCFTGQFLYGTRKKCEQAVAELGGRALSSVRQDLDYLVIGELASRDWAHSSHGRKIEKAKTYQQKGCSIAIVSEQVWIHALG